MASAASASSSSSTADADTARKMVSKIQLPSISKLMSEKGPFISTVVLKADGSTQQLDELDMSPGKMPVAKVLGGSVTILGQWPQLDLVIMCLRDQTGLPPNKHKLQPPFHKASVCGPIMLLRMNEQSIPASFNLKEFEEFQAQEIEPFEVDENKEVGGIAELVASAGGAAEEESDEEADEDEDDDTEWQPKGGEDDDEEEDDEEEADAEDAMYQLLFNKVMSQFKSTHGRDPTEEELKTIFMALNQRTAEAAKAADDGSERESEGDDDDGDSGAAAGAGAGAGSSSSSSSSSATSAPVPRSSPGVKRTETDSPSKDEGDNQQEQDGERANKRARS